MEAIWNDDTYFDGDEQKLMLGQKDSSSLLRSFALRAWTLFQYEKNCSEHFFVLENMASSGCQYSSASGMGGV